MSQPISPEKIKLKLKILADAAKYDASCASSGAYRKRVAGGLGNSEGMGICHSFTPDGRCVSLLKILLTNFCIYDCKFCVNRLSSDTQRARFSPEEVAWLTLEFYRRNYIEGLFLSSGIINSIDFTMEQLIQVAKILRKTHRFGGYIHLKVVPGASPELIQEAGLWADRVSANIELAQQKDLDLLAPAKTLVSAEKSMAQIKHKIEQAKDEKKNLKYAPRFAPAGQTTQMIVGATATSDAMILQASEKLYSDFSLKRVYYSAYSPIPHAHATLPVERANLNRENRLYQADWLIRFYGFTAAELTENIEQNLSLELDPKSAWALNHRGFFPVDVNTATREQLLRVPGLGARSVDRILKTRPYQPLKMIHLQKLGAVLSRAKYFVIASDFNPDSQLLDTEHLQSRILRKDQVSAQMSLFDFGTSSEASLACKDKVAPQPSAVVSSDVRLSAVSGEI